MSEIKKLLIKMTESITFLLIGFLFTFYVLKPVYQMSGIQFMGNVWVNWFGMTYIFFVLYTLVGGLFLFKESILYKQRISSVFFWLLFIGSNYVVFVPFLKGENPF